MSHRESALEEKWLELIRGDRRGLTAGLARAGLRIASAPYGLGVRFRNGLYNWGWKRATRAPVPVVSIGNLTLGGTGKTPCVEYIARFYSTRGVRAAILSRGYGSDAGRNDEAMVLEENLPDVPHLQGADRVALAGLAVEELEAELVILDDGFQHRRLARDLDVVLIDATRPPARDHLFPRGTLREPASGLRRADAIMVTRSDQASADELASLRGWLSCRRPGTPVSVTAHAPLDLIGGEAPEPTAVLAGKPVKAFCGIGNPNAFCRTLQSLGVDIVDYRVYADHHAYTRADVEDLQRWAETLPSDGAVLTTQKDLVKLRIAELGGRPLRAVRIGLQFRDGQPEFDTLLERCIPEARRNEVDSDD
jgi:tetraacyldisaccharide 4'-kinase